MTSEIFRELTLRGAEIWVEGDHLKVRAPGGVPSELASRLKAFKTSLIESLDRQTRAGEFLHGNPRVAAETREVCIQSPWGRVWIVPALSGKDRCEVTWQELSEDPFGALARCQTIWEAVRTFKGRVLAGSEAKGKGD
jgi:hypothetical protein